MRRRPIRLVVLTVFAAILSSGCTRTSRVEMDRVVSWPTYESETRPAGSHRYEVVALRLPDTGSTTASIVTVTPAWCVERLRSSDAEVLCDFRGWAAGLELEIDPFPTSHVEWKYDAFNLRITDLGSEGAHLHVGSCRGAPIVAPSMFLMPGSERFVALELPGFIRTSYADDRFAKCLYVILVKRGDS